MAILACSSGRLAYMDPVGRLVASTPESIGLNESFQQVEAMCVATLPVGINALGYLTQNMACQKFNSYPGQDEKTAIVGDPTQTLFSMLWGPTDPSVSWGTLPSSGTEKYARQITSNTIPDKIAHVFPDRTSVTQVMMMNQIVFKEVIGGLPWSDTDNLQW